jgi:hypothetical protein
MLAPGEYLLLPVQQNQLAPLAGRDTEPNLPALAVRETELTPIVAPAPKPEERPSFLLILLRALGAIHS